MAPPPKIHVNATLRPGCAVVLVNVSGRGALVQGPRPQRPGGRVQLQVTIGNHRWLIAALVTRCQVAALHPDQGVLYERADRQTTAAVSWSRDSTPESSRRLSAGGRNRGRAEGSSSEVRNLSTESDQAQ